MSNRVEKVFLKLTSAIAVEGTILRAGHVIEMLEHEAKDLLRRGKAILATIADHPQAKAPAVEPETSEEPETVTELPANELQAPAPAGRGRRGGAN
ncbi:hypothetical protein [Bradyrhizobium sp. 613_E4_N2_2]|uniref:hypothetical protein n=1 Tax=Bradyrhizobium sp. 613_E4_N2_2 TaxID=3240371 RepID=UPI003F8AE651